jgi:hypothetical protein
MGNIRAYNLICWQSLGLQLEGRSGGPEVMASKTLRGTMRTNEQKGKRGEHEGAFERVKESGNQCQFKAKYTRLLYK